MKPSIVSLTIVNIDGDSLLEFSFPEDGDEIRLKLSDGATLSVESPEEYCPDEDSAVPIPEKHSIRVFISDYEPNTSWTSDSSDFVEFLYEPKREG